MKWKIPPVFKISLFFNISASKDDYTVSLKIPNKEIALIFEDTVVRYFNESVNTDTVNDLINALWSGDETHATEIVDEKYAEGIDGYGKILCYGVAFFQKQAKVNIEI